MGPSGGLFQVIVGGIQTLQSHIFDYAIPARCDEASISTEPAPADT